MATYHTISKVISEKEIIDYLTKLGYTIITGRKLFHKFGYTTNDLINKLKITEHVLSVKFAYLTSLELDELEYAISKLLERLKDIESRAENDPRRRLSWSNSVYLYYGGYDSETSSDSFRPASYFRDVNVFDRLIKTELDKILSMS